MEGTELPNQESTRVFGEKKTYKYYGILQLDTKTSKMKGKRIRKEYLWLTRKHLEIKLCSRNLIKELTTREIPVRYLVPFLKCTKEEKNGPVNKKVEDAQGLTS